MTWFHQHFTQSFYTRRSQKHKKNIEGLTVFFCAFAFATILCHCMSSWLLFGFDFSEEFITCSHLSSSYLARYIPTQHSVSFTNPLMQSSRRLIQEVWNITDCNQFHHYKFMFEFFWQIDIGENAFANLTNIYEQLLRQ